MTQTDRMLLLDDGLRTFIRQLTKSRVLSQRELAAAAGITRSLLTTWLAKRRGITLRTASKLIGVVGLTAFAKFLIEFDDEQGRERSLDLNRLRQAREHLAGRICESPREPEGGAA